MQNEIGSRFKNNYKKSGASSSVDGRLKRAQQRIADRRASRTKEFAKSRNIGTSESRMEPEKADIDTRKLKLQKWKKEKELQKLKEKSKVKPAFKVGSVYHTVGSPYKSDISRYAKPERKPAISKFASMPLNAKHTLIPTNESFAPKNFKFKGPAIKPVLGLSIVNRSNLPTSKTNSKYVEQKHDVPVARRVTRSQTRSTNKELLHVTKPMPSQNQEKKTKAKNVSAMASLSFTAMETVKEEDNACGDTPRNDGESTLLEDNNSDKENVIHVENHSPEKIIAQAKTPLCTPERPVDQDVVLPIHYSPYVTKERGSSRRRSGRRSTMNVDRNSSLRGSPLLESVDNVQNVENIKIHGICYFRSVLKTETERLMALCEEWQNIQSTTFDLPPDVSDLIGVAIGMTKLLLTKKFRQFKGLVDMCENGPKEDEKPVTCSDLDGFWDMMYMEVENLDCRFKNLNDLKSNNWVEKVPEEKKSKPRAPTKRLKKVQKAATSSMKAVIAAAREKQMREINTGSALQTAEIYMPVKTDSVRTPTSRQTLLRQAISGQRESRGVSRRSSPIIMKVSQLAKRISDASNDLEVQPSVSSTPRKSILKTVTTKIQEDKMTTETDVAVDSGPSRRSTRKVRFEGTNNNSPGIAQPMTPFFTSNRRRSMSKQQNDRPSFLNTTDAASPVISFNSDLISFDSPITEPLRVRRRSSRLSQL